MPFGYTPFWGIPAKTKKAHLTKFLWNVVPHLIFLAALSFIFPHKIIGIFIFGLLLPDSAPLFFLFINRYSRFVSKLSYLLHEATHLTTFVLAIYFIFQNEPAYFIAIASHIFLDILGF